MLRTSLCTLFLMECLFTSALLAQSGMINQVADGQPPAFEAVSIRAIQKFRSFNTSSGLTTITTPTKVCEYRPDRVICQLSLKSLLAEAFQLKKQEMASFPQIDDNLFLVQALMPANTAKDTARRMMQQTLEDRFGLRFHLEPRPVRIYAMVAAKQGARLQPAADPGHRKLLDVTTGIGKRKAVIAMSPGRFSASALSLDLLADDLNTLAGMDRPVVNLTGLTGEYQIDLHWTPDEDEQSTSLRIMDSGFPIAVQSQLGLKLERRTLTSDVFVIDHINPVPTEN